MSFKGTHSNMDLPSQQSSSEEEATTETNTNTESNLKFISGCALTAEQRLSFQHIIDGRMARTREAIRDFANFPWTLVQESY